MQVLGVFLGLASTSWAASGQATSNGLLVKAVAEVETHVQQDGREITKLAPAERVAPGDEVLYTLEIHNGNAAALATPTVVYAVPKHMVYVADSATGPGAEVSYSIDGGHSFDRPEALRVRESGRMRVAKSSDYTHLRWILKNNLKSNSVAYARFRAVVK